MGKPQKIEVQLNVYHMLHPPLAMKELDRMVKKLKVDVCKKNGWKLSETKVVTKPEITVVFTHVPGSKESEPDLGL